MGGGEEWIGHGSEERESRESLLYLALVHLRLGISHLASLAGQSVMLCFSYI